MSRQARQPLLVAVLIGVGIVVAQALLVPLFAAPAANLGPRDLPVVVAGPPPAADALAAQLAQRRAGRVRDHPRAGRGRRRRDPA